MISTDPSCNFGMFQSCSIQYGPTPAGYADGGSYTFQGKAIDDMDDHELAHVRNSDMGFVFQSFNLLSRLTVYDNVEIPLLYSDIPPSERRERIEERMKDFDKKNERK